MNKGKIGAILLAVLAAAFYALSTPASKVLLGYVEPTMMAAFLYLGAGIGIGVMYLFGKRNDPAPKLSKKDLPYTLGMIVLDIAAPILLMFGLVYTTSANASLLNNFEIVATAVIALCVFKEAISPRLWVAIALITIASILLSFEDLSSLQFSWGSLLVLGAALCWGLENNCTRSISDKNTYEIVMLKGIFSGLGSLIIGLVIGEKIPSIEFVVVVFVLGFVAYGLSILFYIKAQAKLGAAKTSAYYAIAPFIGVLLSLAFLQENLAATYFPALAIMALGTVVVVMDTLASKHVHVHTHTITHTHDGSTHTHTITHDHGHTHYLNDDKHGHTHKLNAKTHEVH